MILTDRSRIECYQHCPRKRYWNYEYQGHGIVPKRAKSAALEFGSTIHQAIADTFMGAPPNMAMELPETARHAELHALADGMIHAWLLIRQSYYKDNFDIISVEHEEEPVDIGCGVGLMTRSDAVLRRKLDGALFVANWKTTKRADRKWREQFQYDMQTIGEVLGVEQRLGEKCSGVLIEGLLKGEEREYPIGSGQWYQDSPLIWAWHNETGKPHPMGEWTPKWEWQDEEGNHTLGRGWKKRAIWEGYPGGVGEWIGYLYEHHLSVLEEQFVPLPPILRSDWDIERWKRMTSRQERDIAEFTHDIQVLRDLTNVPIAIELGFPMHTHGANCLWPSRCEYFGLCWENAQPDDADLWQPREPNHSTELVQIEVGL